MSLGITAAGWAAIGTAGVGLYSANQQSNAAEDAANAQTSASQAGIAQQNKQFDAIQKLLAPFVTTGTQAVGAQGDLVGLNGAGPQQASIAAIQNSPEFTALNRSGQDAILANASATGGLRGGNVQAALGQFSPQLLAQLIDQQYGRLGGLTSVGQNAAAGVGNAGVSTGNNITQLLGQIGSAQAGNALAQGRANVGYGNALLGGAGALLGSGYVPNQTAFQIPAGFKF